jgi:hypothetical protein
VGGALDASEVIGPVGQGIDPGDFEELLASSGLLFREWADWNNPQAGASG